jgi:hypothetical protein
VAEGGSPEQVRRAADEFQAVVTRLYEKNKTIEKENAEIRSRSRVETRSGTKTIKPGGIVHYETCSMCELNSKALEPDEFYFWKELFESPFRAKEDQRVVFDYRGDQVAPFLSADDKSRMEALKAEVKKLEDSAPEEYPLIMGMADSEQPMNVRLNIRGSVRNLGDPVPRGLPGVLNGGTPVPVANGSGRLELAKAILAHPLAARVMVNRIWTHHFGRGIVDTPSNFGRIGEPPTHPELLDYLAARFRDGGWSVKAIHREIMLSSTYQLSTRYSQNNAAVDAGNQLYWRANRKRLDAESMRDSLLFVSGGLDLETGGESDDLTLEHNRRTLYTWISRRQLDPTLRLFDFPDPTLSSERRTSTNVPTQRLFFMNSPVMAQQAELLAKRLTAGEATDEARIRNAYQLVYGRPATSQEVSMGLEFLGQSAGPPAWQQYAQALLSSNEFYYVD